MTLNALSRLCHILTPLTGPGPSAARHSPPANAHQRGVTAVESLIVLSTAAVALGAALPGLQASKAQRHLDGSAAQLETDIQHARSLAVAQHRNLRMSFFRDSHGSCYVVHSGPAGSCQCTPTGEALCSGGTQAARSHRFTADSAVQLQANVSGITFDANKGTVTPTTTLRLAASETRSVNVVVNVMGRVRNCAPASATDVRGYTRC
jgi:type IV fimbrial biogenesis protein FimT